MDALLALTVRSGKVLRVSLPDGHVETLIEDVSPIPDGIVVESGVIYWTTMGVPEVRGEGEANRDYSRNDGGLHAVGLDSTGRRDVVPAGTITTGKQVTSDGAGTLYWADREGCRVGRVRTDGSGLTDLVVNTRDDSWMEECVGVAVDPARRDLYWTQKGPAKGGKGRIFRAGIEIPPGETAADRSDIEVLWDGLPEPIDLHLAGDWLYWTDRGAPPAGNTLNRAPLPARGQPGSAPQILADKFTETIGLAVDVEAGIAYVGDLGGHIRAVHLPDGPAPNAPSHLLVVLPEPITGIAGV